jgi:hypothetical protein
MKAILLIILISISIQAKSVKPRKMYDHKNLIENMLLPLKQYITKIKQLYPYDRDSNNLYFYTENSLYSHFLISLNKVDNQYVISFQSENHELVTFIYEFEKESDYNLDQMLNSDFISTLDNQSYSLKILPRGFTLNSELIDDKRRSQYVYSLDATTMNLEETFKENFYSSKLFYKCSRCGGEILRAMFSDTEEFYFVGLDQHRVNDRDFFNQANRWYLSPLLGLVAGTISSKVEAHIWPHDE